MPVDTTDYNQNRLNCFIGLEYGFPIRIQLLMLYAGFVAFLSVLNQLDILNFFFLPVFFGAQIILLLIMFSVIYSNSDCLTSIVLI